MNHPTDDELLLLAYGELGTRSTEAETHITVCPACQERLAQLERARVALDVALPARRRHVTWAAAGFALAAAAVLAGVLITRTGPSRDDDLRWNPSTTWSATAGYVAGGKAMVDIDAQLTRLEQERFYARP
jgi:uncharacterized protein YfaQ (DUF2300 family)